MQAGKVDLQGRRRDEQTRTRRIASFLQGLQSPRLLAFHGVTDLPGPWQAANGKQASCESFEKGIGDHIDQIVTAVTLWAAVESEEHLQQQVRIPLWHALGPDFGPADFKAEAGPAWAKSIQRYCFDVTMTLYQAVWRVHRLQLCICIADGLVEGGLIKLSGQSARSFVHLP